MEIPTDELKKIIKTLDELKIHIEWLKHKSEHQEKVRDYEKIQDEPDTVFSQG